MTRTAIDFSFGVGTVCFLWRYKTRPVRMILRLWTLELPGYSFNLGNRLDGTEFDSGVVTIDFCHVY
jgi:hypothetical protein